MDDKRTNDLQDEDLQVDLQDDIVDENAEAIEGPIVVDLKDESPKNQEVEEQEKEPQESAAQAAGEVEEVVGNKPDESQAADDTGSQPEPQEPIIENQESSTDQDQSTTTLDEVPGKWYVVHIKTGYENRVKKSLEQRIKSLGVDDRIFEIVVPMRDVVVVKKGKKSKVSEKVFPGYILVKMELDDDSWLAVRTTEGVTGFVGAGLKPTPISAREVAAIMKFLKQEQPKFKTKFSVGEAVKINDGPFADFLGTIQGIDDARGKVKVLVSIFDRETPVELDFLQVNKL